DDREIHVKPQSPGPSPKKIVEGSARLEAVWSNKPGRPEGTGAMVMAMRLSGAAIGEIHTLFRWGAMGTWTDGQLMTQFATGQEGGEAAFRILIHRHGPMVLGICRRVLGDEHAAEDAFQATFLVLVKKAGTLRDGDLLTNWLYGVALRVAQKEKARGARRRVVERQAAERTVPAA